MNSLLEIATALLFVVGCMNVQFAEGGVDVNEIYSIDRKELDENNRTLSVTIDEDSNVRLEELSTSSLNQRYVARPNSDSTFTLFLENQPWNWVEHIVERTKHVNIPIVPKVLGVVGASKEVTEQDYSGTGANSQKWYVVPTGFDPNTGVLTNLLMRECLTSQGESMPLTIAPCNLSETNQIFSLKGRKTGRTC